MLHFPQFIMIFQILLVELTRCT